MARHFRLKPTKPDDQAEKEVIEACRQILGRHAFRLERIPCGLHYFPGGQPVTYGEPGTPDYVALNGSLPPFYLETKATKGTLSPIQNRQHWILKQFFGLQVVTAHDRDALIDFLTTHEQKYRPK